MAISSPGIGSRLDVNAIVRQLMAIERRPIQQIESQTGSLQTQLSAFARVRSDLSGLQDAAARLLDPSLWGSRSFSSSNSAALTGSASSSALASSFSVQIARLAQPQGAASAGRAIDAPLGAAGSLEFRVGTWTGNSFGGGAPVSVAVQADDTLSTLAARINAGNAGVSALVLRSGGQEQLMLRGSNTGAAAGFEVRALDSGGAPITTGSAGLGVLNHFHNGTAMVGMGRTQDALDAQFSVDGVALASPTNTVSNVVPGLTLNLQQSTTAALPGSPATAVQVSVQQNNTVVRDAIEAFRAAYNRINSTLSELTRADPTGNADGPLQADGTARRLQTALRQLVMSEGPSGGSPLGRLSDMGLQMQRDGSLGVNATRLDAAMANQEGMRRLLADTGTAGANVGIARRMRDFAFAANGIEGSVSSRNGAIQAAIGRNSERIERLEDRLERTQASLLAQYSRLDTNMAALNGLDSFVSQQLAQWNRSSL